MMQVTLFVVLAMTLGTAATKPTPGETEVLAWMKELSPLQKVHYSWPIPNAILDDPNDPRFFEYVRLTHAACVGDYATQRQFESAIIVCRAVNRNNPKIKASVGLNYSPWHRVFGKELPPTDWGSTYTAELERFKRVLNDMKKWLSISNKRYNCDIELTALLLDSERFNTQPGQKSWNDAITRKHNEIYDIGREVFPKAMIIPYGRGIQRVAYGSGWDQFNYSTLEEKGDCYSCALYCVPEIERMRETFRRTYQLAKAHGSDVVVPYVALGCGYRRQADKFQEWNSDWDYDVVYSWLLGAEINHPWFAARSDRYAPWNAAKVVKFYPGPFSENTPSWGKHFVAYVRGANMVRRLPETAKSEHASPDER